MPAGNFVPTRYLAVLSAVFCIEMALFYGAARYENAPVIAPLEQFPGEIAAWRVAREIPMEQAVQDVLRADDTMNRVYTDPATGETASLFIAFFRTQRTGQTPHSPKNCLPGAGYEPVESGQVRVAVPGSGEIGINRYLVTRGEERNLVLYWYQSRGRAIGNEFSAKFWLIADSIRYRRSDTALVRVVVPVVESEASAERTGRRFVQNLYPALLSALEPKS